MFRRVTSRLCSSTSTGGAGLTAFAQQSIARAGKHSELQLIECPRDAMQGLRDFVKTEDKIRYINALLKVGFHTIDCGSFVSAPAVPQMRDTAEVLKGLDLTGTNSKLLVVVANLAGCKRACEEERVNCIGYPLSISETFQKKNTNRTIATAFEDVQKLNEMCVANGKEFVLFISMAFGNPYGEAHGPQLVDSFVERAANMGIKTISLADTVGVSTAESITEMYSRIIPKYPDVRIGGHFHSGAVTSEEKVTAALAAGCRRLEGAIGGMGGCPFAKSTLVGNVATECIVDTLRVHGVAHSLDEKLLPACYALKHELFGVAVKELLLATVLDDELAFSNCVRRHFQQHDTDNNGVLRKPEFISAVKDVFAELGEEEPDQARIDRVFDRLDIMKKGVITVDAYMMESRRLLAKRLDQLKNAE